MRLPKILGVIAVVGLSVLAVTYVFRPPSSDNEAVAATHEQALQQEIKRLHATIDNLTTERNQLRSNQGPIAATSPASTAASTSAALAVATSAAAPTTAAAGGSSPPFKPPAVPIMIGRTPALMEVGKPTPEQSTAFENLKKRFDDPSFVRTLNLAALTQMEDVKALPGRMQQQLLAQAMEKYNRGEVDEQTFLAGMPGYPQ